MLGDRRACSFEILDNLAPLGAASDLGAFVYPDLNDFSFEETGTNLERICLRRNWMTDLIPPMSSARR